MNRRVLALLKISATFFIAGAAAAQQRIDEGSTSSGPPCISSPMPPKTSDGLGNTAAIDTEALTVNSDFTIFMKHGAPCDVQSRALRRLWTADPDP